MQQDKNTQAEMQTQKEQDKQDEAQQHLLTVLQTASPVIKSTVARLLRREITRLDWIAESASLDFVCLNDDFYPSMLPTDIISLDALLDYINELEGVASTLERGQAQTERNKDQK